VRGKVELAAGGTLFLDELGEIPLELQGKLLRFLQEKRFERVGGRETLEADVRIVAATNRDLAAAVKAGKFRSDLFYRVRVVDVELPPLRARGAGDVLALADHFVDGFARKYGKPVALGAEARAALCAHSWPGNVRELEHCVERAVVLAEDPELDAEALGLGRGQAAPATGPGVTLPPGLTLAEAERHYARAALVAANGNRSAAARALGIGRNKLAKLVEEGE
jgi:Nif-specific regulatory protein